MMNVFCLRDQSVLFFIREISIALSKQIVFGSKTLPRMFNLNDRKAASFSNTYCTRSFKLRSH